MNLQKIVAYSGREEGKINYSCPVSGWDEWEAAYPETFSDIWEWRSQRSIDFLVSLSLQSWKTDDSWGLDFLTLTSIPTFLVLLIFLDNDFCLPLSFATWQQSSSVQQMWRCIVCLTKEDSRRDSFILCLWSI